MTTTPTSVPELDRLFRRIKIADLERLYDALGTRSRMTVFRRLSTVGYRSSCSHAGRYYTLRDIPVFDPDGLWRYQGVLFSQDGTLKDTLTRLVATAADGLMHREIEARVGLRVHNTLADLVLGGRLGRQRSGDAFLYVSADQARAAAQMAARAARPATTAGTTADLAPSLVIEVLLEVVHGSAVVLDAVRVQARLAARGVAVTVAQVEEVFRRHDLGKKTVPSRSRRSRR